MEIEVGSHDAVVVPDDFVAVQEPAPEDPDGKEPVNLTVPTAALGSPTASNVGRTVTVPGLVEPFTSTVNGGSSVFCPEMFEVSDTKFEERPVV